MQVKMDINQSEIYYTEKVDNRINSSKILPKREPNTSFIADKKCNNSNNNPENNNNVYKRKQENDGDQPNKKRRIDEVKQNELESEYDKTTEEPQSRFIQVKIDRYRFQEYCKNKGFTNDFKINVGNIITKKQADEEDVITLLKNAIATSRSRHKSMGTYINCVIKIFGFKDRTTFASACLHRLGLIVFLEDHQCIVTKLNKPEVLLVHGLSKNQIPIISSEIQKICEDYANKKRKNSSNNTDDSAVDMERKRDALLRELDENYNKATERPQPIMNAWVEAINKACNNHACSFVNYLQLLQQHGLQFENVYNKSRLPIGKMIIMDSDKRKNQIVRLNDRIVDFSSSQDPVLIKYAETHQELMNIQEIFYKLNTEDKKNFNENTFSKTLTDYAEKRGMTFQKYMEYLAKMNLSVSYNSEFSSIQLTDKTLYNNITDEIEKVISDVNLMQNNIQSSSRDIFGLFPSPRGKKTMNDVDRGLMQKNNQLSTAQAPTVYDLT